jgi:cell division protein FtsW (lipid II flippase)
MRRDFGLLFLVFVILLLGHAILWYAYPGAWAHFFPGRPWLVLAPPVAMTVAWTILLGVLRRKGAETLLIPVVALLAGVGLLFLLRLAGGAYALQMRDSLVATFFTSYQKQLTFFFLGWLALLLVVAVPWDLRALGRYKYLVAFSAVALLLATTLFGHTTADQQLSIHLGPLSFQPHDPVKLLLVIFMAAYLAEHQEMLEFAARTRTRLLSAFDLRYLGPMVGLWLLVMAIVFVHKDLGAALLLFGILLGMLYLGTGRKTYVLLGAGLFALGGFAAYHLFTRIQTRVAIWLDPWRPEYITEKSFQICQALMALGNGRVIGAGLAGGFPENIPAVHTDMIYAAISEDLGLVGAAVVLACFAVAIQRCFAVALRATDRFGQLLAAGLAVSLAFQTLVILGGVVKAIPLTGITLPFISYGGTSLVVNCLMLGLVLKASARRETAK